ncbi:hypothetical protein L0F63_006762, partial [Massospora cicadina]
IMMVTPGFTFEASRTLRNVRTLLGYRISTRIKLRSNHYLKQICNARSQIGAYWDDRFMAIQTASV